MSTERPAKEGSLRICSSQACIKEHHSCSKYYAIGTRFNSFSSYFNYKNLDNIHSCFLDLNLYQYLVITQQPIIANRHYIRISMHSVIVLYNLLLHHFDAYTGIFVRELESSVAVTTYS